MSKKTRCVGKTLKGLLQYCLILTIILCLYNSLLLLELRKDVPSNGEKQQQQEQELNIWNGTKQETKQSTIAPKNTSTENSVDVASIDDANDAVNYTFYYPPPHEEILLKYKNVSLAIKPTLGVHRPNVDVVMTFSVGYQLPEIIYFLTSLIDTGFQGDIVLGMKLTTTTTTTNNHNSTTGDEDETQDFLSWYSTHHHVIVYNIPLNCCCPKIGSLCKIQNMYQDKFTRIYFMDHRPRRLVAQLRFEYYWAWTTFYSSTSRILLTDARDVYFQSNPFDHVGGNKHHIPMTAATTTTTKMDTILHVYQDTERIQTNLPESNWIRKIYNQSILDQIGHLPGICSGTVLGGQPAMETYTRAMVREWDETRSKNGIGMDQGRHIFLIYMNKLVGAPNITRVVSFPMGMGEVNTVGVPLKELRVPLTEWPMFDGKNHLILNHDGRPSAVVHMFDRHPLLKSIIQNRTDVALQNWRDMRKNGIANMTLINK